jgi:hypothetical protein
MQGYLGEADFRRLIDEVFAPFLMQLGFGLSEYKVTDVWRFAEFTGHGLAVRVNYEFPMHYADVKVHTRSDICRPHIASGTTLPISALTEQYLGQIEPDELDKNDRQFAGIEFACPEAVRLFVMAKQLRIVLPRWMQDHRLG